MQMDIGHGNITLTGSFNGHLCSQRLDYWVDYSLTFYGVLALKMTELDSSIHMYPHLGASSFDEVLNSTWEAQAQLGGTVTPEHKHYLIRTYDYVFELICQRCKLTTQRGEQV